MFAGDSRDLFPSFLCSNEPRNQNRRKIPISAAPVAIRHDSPQFFPPLLQIYDTNIEASGGIKAAFVQVSECITSLDNPHDLCRRTSPQLYSVPLRISVDQLGVIVDLRELEFMFAAESHLKCFPLSQVFCASRAPPGVSTGIQPGAPA